MKMQMVGALLGGLLVAGCLPGGDGDPARGGNGGASGGSGGSDQGTGGEGGSAPETCEDATRALEQCLGNACGNARAAVVACLQRIFDECQSNGTGGSGGGGGCESGGGMGPCDPEGCTLAFDGTIVCPDGVPSDCRVEQGLIFCPDGRTCRVGDDGLIHCDDGGSNPGSGGCNGALDPNCSCDPTVACAAELDAAGTCGDACATEAADQSRLCQDNPAG